MISVLNRAAGFFSQFFFTVNHYIYCLKHKIDFTLDSTEWTFSYENGWTDYFLPIELRFPGNKQGGRYGHGNVIEDIPRREYTIVLPIVYQLNENIRTQVNETMDRLGLVINQYDSIFIRRGDKLLCESRFIETEEYIETLLMKNPECNTVFLQTDDYQCYIDIQSFLKKRSLDIRVVTLCDENLFGFTMSGTEFYHNTSCFEENQPYIESVREKNVKNKLIFDFNKEEMREHMTTFLVGIEIILQSAVCVTDYSSNVARFAKLWKGDSVIHVRGEEYDENSQSCPSY
jgi:hypothetical protein